MRTLLFLSLIFLIQIKGFAQDDSLRQRYLQKAKNKSTGAWILLSGGLVLGTIGSVSANKEVLIDAASGQNPDINSGKTLMTIGIITMAASIPFFIGAGVNKRKAKLMLSTSYSPRLQAGSIGRIQQPVLKFCWRL